MRPEVETAVLNRLRCGTSVENIVLTTPGVTFSEVARLAGTVSYEGVIDGTRDTDVAELVGEFVEDAPSLADEMDTLAIHIVHKLGRMIDDDDEFTNIGYATKCLSELKTAFSAGGRARGGAPIESERGSTKFIALLGK